MIPCVNLTLNNLLVGGSVGKTLRVTLPDHSWIPPLRPIRCSCDVHSCELRITNAPSRNRNAVSQSVAPANVRLGTRWYIPYVSRWRVGARPFSGPAVYSAHCCRPRGCSGAGTPPPPSVPPATLGVPAPRHFLFSLLVGSCKGYMTCMLQTGFKCT